MKTKHLHLTFGLVVKSGHLLSESWVLKRAVTVDKFDEALAAPTPHVRKDCRVIADHGNTVAPSPPITPKQRVPRGPAGFSYSKLRMPSVNSTLRDTVLRTHLSSLAELRAKSPIPCGTNGLATQETLELRFDKNTWLWLGGAVNIPFIVGWDFKARISEDVSRIAPSPMAPSPMPIDWHQNWSQEHFGERCHLVTEFMSGTGDEQASLISYLQSLAPLALVVLKGGSLEAWWGCAAATESSILRFFRRAVAIGANPRTWSRCALVSLPGGYDTETGAHQTVIYARKNPLLKYYEYHFD